MLGNDVQIQSAGSRPASISPYTIEVLEEIGIDISSQWSKNVDTIDLSVLDLVITLCAEEECPILPVRVEKQHWPIEDPADAPEDRESQLAAYRAARDEIKGRLEEYAKSL